MKVELHLSPREADAILRAELGWGRRKSQTLQSAQFKLREAILTAERAEAEQRKAPA